MKILTLTLFALFLAAGDEPAPQAPIDPSILVEFQNQQLSVHAERVPLSALLAEIQEKSGIAIDFRDEKAAASEVSVDLKNVAPARALEEILRGLNFAYFYSGARLTRVVVLPQGGKIFKPAAGIFQPGRLQGILQRKLPALPLKDKAVSEKLGRIDELDESKDPKSGAALGEFLTDPNSEVKEAALQALADKPGANVTQLIRRGLNDKDPEFRISVLEVLADRGDLESLRKAKSDPNEDVRERVADLLENATP